MLKLEVPASGYNRARFDRARGAQHTHTHTRASFPARGHFQIDLRTDKTEFAVASPLSRDYGPRSFRRARDEARFIGGPISTWDLGEGGESDMFAPLSTIGRRSLIGYVVAVCVVSLSTSLVQIEGK